MALNVVGVVDAVMAHVRSELPYDVFEQGVPDVDTIRRLPNGQIRPYVAVQFGSPRAKARGRGFAGVRYDEYELPVYVQVVAGDASVTRNIGLGLVLDALLGFSTDWSSQMVQRSGGSVYAMSQANEATEAFVFPLGFGLSFQMDPS